MSSDHSVRRRAVVLAVALATSTLLAAAGHAGAAGSGGIPGPPGDNPGSRGFEKVTPADKGGLDVGGVSYNSRTKASVDGNSFVFSSAGVFANAPGGAFPSYYLAQRGGDGWFASSMTPPSSATVIGGDGGAGRTATVLKVDERLDLSLVETNAALIPGMFVGVPNIFTRDRVGRYGIVTPAGPSFGEAVAGVFVLSRDVAPWYQAATADGRHVLFVSAWQFTPDALVGVENLYESVGGVVRLVGLLPGEVPSPTGAYAGSGYTSTHNAISDDGSRIYFSTVEQGIGPLYLRENGATTEIAPGDATFYSATADGSQAIYTVSGATSDLFRYDVSSGLSEKLSVDDEPADGTDPLVVSVLAASDELDYVYFVARGDLVPGQTPLAGDAGIYLWHGGTVRHIGTLADDQDNGFGPGSGPYGSIPNVDAWISRPYTAWTPDGKSVVFDTTARVTSYDPGGFREVYRYDADSNEISCLSCPDGPARGDAVLGGDTTGFLGTYSRPLGRRNTISDDGRRVFFSSQDSLVLEDVNGRYDGYVWQDGQPHLISDGATRQDARILDASRSGDDVFFATRARLVASDEDDLVDIYDARIGGGKPETKTESPPPCEGEDCQGLPSGPVVDTPPATQALQGPGDPPSSTSPTIRLKALTAGQRAALARGATTSLSVTVNRAGAIDAIGTAKIGRRQRIVLRAATTAKRAGTVKLSLRLSAIGRRALKQRRALTVKLAVRFASVDGSQRSKLRLRIAPRSRRRGR